MGHFFAEVFIGMIMLIGLCIFLALILRMTELIWLCLYKIFSPCLCPTRHREPWPIEICNCILYYGEKFVDLCIYCCSGIRKKIKKCKRERDKVKIKPIIYDDVHIIVVNPYENYQIATVSKIITT